MIYSIATMQARNRFAHDEMESSSFDDSARVYKVRRKGDPHGEGWMTVIEQEDVKRERKALDSAQELLTSFTLYSDKKSDYAITQLCRFASRRLIAVRPS